MSKYLKTVSFWIDELIQDKDKYEIKKKHKVKTLIYMQMFKNHVWVKLLVEMVI